MTRIVNVWGKLNRGNRAYAVMVLCTTVTGGHASAAFDHVDHAIQLLYARRPFLHRRRTALRECTPGQRSELIRHNVQWRDRNQLRSGKLYNPSKSDLERGEYLYYGFH